MISISISQAKNELTRILHDVEKGNPVELTRHGKSAAVILSFEDYEALLKNRPSFSAALNNFYNKTYDYEIDDAVFDKLRSAESGRDIVL
jgi:prevent-host-death family protein